MIFSNPIDGSKKNFHIWERYILLSMTNKQYPLAICKYSGTKQCANSLHQHISSYFKFSYKGNDKKKNIIQFQHEASTSHCKFDNH